MTSLTSTSGRAPDRPILLVIAPGYEAYRRYHLESLAPAYAVHLVVDAPVDWARSLVDGEVPVDDFAPATMLAALEERGLAARVEGVLAWDESKIAAAAVLADELGLPAPAPAAVEAVRDKARTRAALGAAGVPQPRFALASSAREAAVAAEALGWPVVVKPRGAAASYGVTIVSEPAELADAVGRALAVRFGAGEVPDRSVLIEECVVGPEISVDSAIDHGTLTPVCIARKRLGFPPMCEEVGHVVDAADPLLHDPALRAVLADAHDALGFTHGWTHTELKLTADGPKIIEVNGRLGGDLIPYLGERATGVDLIRAAAALATGRPPQLRPTRQRVAAIRFLYPPVETFGATVIDSDFDPAARGMSGVDRAAPLVAPGDAVPVPSDGLPERVAYAVAVADTVAGCDALLDRLERAFTLHTTRAARAVART